MVKIINPYNGNANNGIGQSLAQLGQALFGDQVGSDYRRAQLFGKEMENQGRMDVSSMYSAGGDPDYNQLTAAAVRAGMPNIGEFERFRAANVYGAASPRTTNAFVGAGGSYASTAAGFNRAQEVELEKTRMNAQKVYDAALATANNTPMNVIGPSGPMVMSRADAIKSGARPVLSLSDTQGAYAQGVLDAANMENGPGGIATLKPSEQKFIGAYAADTKPDLFVYDGGTATVDPRTNRPIDAMTNEPLPQGTKLGKVVATSTDGFSGNSTVDKQLLESRTATDRAVAAIDNLSKMLEQPNADQSTGYVGRAANLYTDIRSQLEAVTRFVGGETVQQAISRPDIANSLNQNMDNLFRNERFNERVRALGIDNAKIQSQVIDLAYMIAKAQDPGGRMSNQDIENASRVVMGSILDPMSGIAVLQDLKGRLAQNQKIFESNLMRLYPQAARNMAARPNASVETSTGAPTAPTAQTGDLYSKYGLTPPGAR